jgi:Putative zincin peptidase
MTSQTLPYRFDVALTRDVIVRLSAYSILLFWVAFELFDAVAFWVLPSMDAATVSAGVLVFVATIVLHEWTHGASMRLFGARPSYGLALVGHILPAAYAAAPGYRFTLRQMIVVALAPFVLLSAATLTLAMIVPSSRFYAFLAFTANFTGAVGDLWMAAVIWRFHRCRDVVVVDQMSGLTIESTDPAAAVVAAGMQSRGHRMTRLAAGSLAAMILIVWTGLPIAEYFAPGAADIRVGPAWFPILEYTQHEHGVWVYYRNLVVASIIMALPAMLIPRRRRASEHQPEQPRPDSPPGVPSFI